MSTRLYVFAVIATMSTAAAHAAEETAAYLVAASDGAPVTTASGACVRTSEWNPAASYRDCDPLPIAKLVPAYVEPARLDSPLRAEPIRISMNTLFDFDSAVLRADAGPALDALAKQLMQENYQKVDIVGHANRMARGSTTRSSPSSARRRCAIIFSGAAWTTPSSRPSASATPSR